MAADLTSDADLDPSTDGLPPADRFLLYVLDREFATDRVAQADLVAETGLAPSTATEALERLAERGLVDRRPNPADARRKIVERLG